MQAGARNRGSVSSFGVAMAPSLALLCVILCCAPSLVLSSRHHGSSRASHCEGSSDLALINDKIKRGPFSDVQQMERVQMLDGLFARITHHLKKSGIAFWAERDTLLSAYQHGSTFPYSQQLDLAIMSNFFASAVAEISLMSDDKGTIELKSDQAQGEILVSLAKSDIEATVRIAVYTEVSTPNGRFLVNPASTFQPNFDTVFPLKKAIFNHKCISVPADSESYLMGQYGPTFAQPKQHFDWETMSYTTKGADNFPLVSIIIPTYDRPRFLTKSIELIKRQDYPNIEVVIVDDSAQSNAALIEGEDSRFRYYHLTSRKSIGMKRNIAVENAKGSIIVHWDDDDFFREHRVTQQVAPIIRGEVEMTVLEHHYYLHLPTQSFYHVRRASTWGPHFATFVYSKKLWDGGLRYPDNSMAEDYAFAEASLHAGYKISVQNNEDGKHVYVRHSNTWEFDLEDYAAHVQKVDRPKFFSEEDLSFFLNIEIKANAKPPKHYAAASMRWDRPELKPVWKEGDPLAYPPYYPPYYPNYEDDDDVFDATWIFVGVAATLPIVLACGLGGYFIYKRKQQGYYTLLGEERDNLSSVA